MGRAHLQPLEKAVDTQRSLTLENAIGVYELAREFAKVAPPDFDPVIGREPDVRRRDSPPVTEKAVRRAETAVARSETVIEQSLPIGSQMVAIGESVEAGNLLASTVDGRLLRNSLVADALVYGIVAGAPGRRFSEQAPVAFAGVATLCRVDASAAPVAVGDLLVSSRLLGYAMNAPDTARAGTVVAKALEAPSSGSGTLRVLVMSR